MNGLITTFYSYKGGVGRSFLLANIAALLSRWGYKVLCVDWDIEAPGLDEYFRPWMTQPETPGLVEFATAFSDGKSPDWRKFVSKLTLPGGDVPLAVMTSGVINTTFMSRVQAINWRDLYDNSNFGLFLEEVREQWKETYDFVLVDSRTGITDIGGICTVHLPDLLLFVFTANKQSLDGVIRVVQQAKSQRARLPLNRAGLLTLPIPSRFDARGQEKLANEWLRLFADKLETFYDDWLDTEITPRQVIDTTKLPYFSAWTFGERLAVLEERENDPERISYYFTTIAALLARRLGHSDQLYRSRDVYVAGAKQAGTKSADNTNSLIKFDYYLSYARESLPVARELAEAIKTSGKRVFIDAQELSSGEDFRSNIEAALSGSNEFLLLASGPPSGWQLSEAISFLNQDASKGRKLTIIGTKPTLAVIRKDYSSLLAKKNCVKTIATTDWSVAGIHDTLLGKKNVTPGKKTVPIDSKLRKLAGEYISVKLPSWSDRVARKDLLAKKLGQHVIAHRTSHDQLAKAKHDGLIVALAEAAKTSSEPGDISRLLLSGLRIKLLHPAYRLLLSVGALTDRERVTIEDRKALMELLDSYEKKAHERKDAPLASLVATTRQRFEKLQ